MNSALGSVPTSSTGLHDVHLGLGSQVPAILVVQDLEEVIQLHRLAIFSLEESFLPMGHEHHKGTADRVFPVVYGLLEFFHLFQELLEREDRPGSERL
jgi:hypothetical protein